MAQLWMGYGKKITVIFYLIAIILQTTVCFLVFEGKAKLVMIAILIAMTTIAMYLAYKIANKFLT